MAIRRIGYQDTVPSLELVQQTYSRLRIPKLFPSEPLVDEYLTTCVLNQSWPGMTVAQSLDKGAGQGVYATLPLYKNKVVVEYHGRRRATIEANRLLQSLLGEDDGSNYFLTVDQDVTIDAREKVCTCHPHQQCFGRLVNHKANEDSPNLKCKALVVDGLKIPFLVATQDITAGEELCFDYGVRPGQFNEGYEQI
ncbi:N-lysine methyltransferase KMT5A-A-like [Artemia franciscana]